MSKYEASHSVFEQVYELIKTNGYHPVMHEVERAVIKLAIAEAKGNRAQAGRLMKMQRTTLAEKIKRLRAAGQEYIHLIEECVPDIAPTLPAVEI